MNLHYLDGIECLVEELEVGDKFMLVCLSPEETNWDAEARRAGMPNIIKDKVLTVDNIHRYDGRVGYIRDGGQTGGFTPGAIVVKLYIGGKNDG